jgi:hypothetical protein
MMIFIPARGTVYIKRHRSIQGKEAGRQDLGIVDELEME